MMENIAMSYPILCGQTIEIAFESAKAIATATFMKGLPIQIERNTSRECSVEFDSLTKSHVLHTKASSAFVVSIAEIFGNYQDAWLLTLAHENGHMRLNQICADAGAEPSNSNNQTDAMGISLNESQQKWIPDFHKESAIEAYCDACLLQYAAKQYPNQWTDIATKLLAIRDSNSSCFKRSPNEARYGDEYFCSDPIRTALKIKAPILPTDAAKVAFTASIRNTSLPLDMINASHVAIDDLIDRLKPTLPHGYQKAIHASIAVVGRFQAEYQNIKARLEARRTDDSIKQSPPPTP